MPGIPQSKAAKTAPEPREHRKLSKGEAAVQLWVKRNRGIISKIARELNFTPQFVHRIAYNQSAGYGQNEARSRGLVIERALRAAGCPMIQKIR